VFGDTSVVSVRAGTRADGFGVTGLSQGRGPVRRPSLPRLYEDEEPRSPIVRAASRLLQRHGSPVGPAPIFVRAPRRKLYRRRPRLPLRRAQSGRG